MNVITEFPDVITGITEEGENQKFKLYPNPATNVIKWHPPENAELRHLVIYNLMGQQTVFMDLTSSGIGELNISSLPAGWYLAQLNAQRSSYWTKFIKR